MKISGIQRLTLLDYPGKTACTIFTPGCNMRCRYCYNKEFVLPECINKIKKTFIPEVTFFKFLKQRVGMLQGVCITGGEPTLQPDLAEFIKKIKDMGFAVKLDTNGSDTKLVKELIDKKLIDYIAMDVKASPKKHEELTQCQIPFDTLGDTIELIKASGIDYEFRTTVIKQFHDGAELKDLWQRIKGAKRYALQNFSPKQGCLDETYEKYTGFTPAELEQMKKAAEKYVQQCEIRS